MILWREMRPDDTARKPSVLKRNEGKRTTGFGVGKVCGIIGARILTGSAMQGGKEQDGYGCA
jgi:hypothetical protein